MIHAQIGYGIMDIKPGRVDIEELHQYGLVNTPYRVDLMDWLIMNDNRVFISEQYLMEQYLMVQPWVASAMRAYGVEYADMQVSEYLSRLSGRYEND